MRSSQRRLDRLPGQLESGQILAETIGVVAGFLFRMGNVEKHSVRFGKRRRFEDVVNYDWINRTFHLWHQSFITTFRLLRQLDRNFLPILPALSFTQIGLITLVFQFTSSVFQPVVGWFTDKRPKPTPQ